MAKKSFPVFSLTLRRTNGGWESREKFVWVSEKTKGICSASVVLCHTGLNDKLHLPNVDELVVDIYPKMESRNSFQIKSCHYDGELNIDMGDYHSNVWVGYGLVAILKQIMKDYKVDSLWVNFCYWE